MVQLPLENFSYVAIITEIDKGHGLWLDTVTDEEYHRVRGIR
jgi:hypothetical protein